MNLPAESSFVQPYFIEELGDFGVSTLDIAKALNAKHFDVTRKYMRQKEFYDTLGSAPYVVNLKDVQGKSVKGWYFSVTLAKYIVASWKNERGAGYFMFLMECERVATEMVPLLIEENRLLKEEIGRQKLKKLKKAKTGLKQYITTDLYGNEIVKTYRAPLSELSEAEILRGQLHKLSAQSRGMAQRIEWLQAEVAKQSMQTEKDLDLYKTVRPKPRLKRVQ